MADGMVPLKITIQDLDIFQNLKGIADELAGALRVITEDSRFLKCFTSDKDDTLFDRIDNALARYDAVNDNQQEAE